MKEGPAGSSGALGSDQVTEMLQKQTVGVRADLVEFAQKEVARAMAKADGSVLSEAEMSLVGIFFEDLNEVFTDQKRATLKKELVALQKGPLVKKLENWGLPKPVNQLTTSKEIIVDQLLEHFKVLGSKAQKK